MTKRFVDSCLSILILFTLTAGMLFFNALQKDSSKISIASYDPGPIAPIGPESPPQPIDDESVT